MPPTLSKFSVAAALLAVGVGSMLVRRTLATSPRLTPALPSALKLHVYDHCPYCVRAMLALGRLKVPYELVVYGYGEGADASKCEGMGYNSEGGPVLLTGKKMLPVLQGDGVPVRDPRFLGMPESLEIVSYVIAAADEQTIAPATGRDDLAALLTALRPVANVLLRPRLINMPVGDWADPRDREYAIWKYTKQGFDYSKAIEMNQQMLDELKVLLAEVDSMLAGHDAAFDAPCLNAWGFSVDDILLLPTLRNLTCVAGVDWPPKVLSYVKKSCELSGVALYDQGAI